MKGLRKVCSLFVFCTVGMVNLGSSSYAEGNLDHSGEMRLKTDLIGEDTAERQKQDIESQKETELEKLAPGLFREQTRAAIQDKKTEQDSTLDHIEENLFVQPGAPSSTLEVSKNTLFSTDYKVQSPSSVNQIGSEGSSPKIVTALVGFVVACCGGVYFMMRRLLE